MLDHILKIKGVEKLEKQAQKEVNGGRRPGGPAGNPCAPTGYNVLNWSEETCFGYGIFWWSSQNICVWCH